MDSILKTRLRMLLTKGLAFFGGIAMSLHVVKDKQTERAATNGKTVFFNEEWFNTIPGIEKVFVWAHETLHAALGHCDPLRKRDRDSDKWNRACDYVVNLLLADAGLAVPEYALFDRQWAGMSVEQVYPHMRDEEQSSDKDIREGEPGCEIMGKAMLAQAAQAAKLAGDLPEGLARLVESILFPRVPWQQAVKDFLTVRVKNDYDWSKPNKRFDELYIPSLGGEDLGDIVVAVDTSGSIGQDILDKFAAELTSIVSLFTCAVHVVYVDTEAYTGPVFESGEAVKLEPQGGGGTDFRPAFEWVKKQDMEVYGLIYLTDGYCSSFPKSAPEYPVLWAIGGNAWPYNQKPFGNTTYMGV